MANDKRMTSEEITQVWHTYLTTGKQPEDAYHPWYTSNRLRPVFRHLPSEPRCRICYYPFAGVGGRILRGLFKIKPSKMNPRLCNICEQFASRYRGGAEIDLTILFADIRGSTNLAQKMKPPEFSQLINRFYKVTTRILYANSAMVEKMIGDAVTGFFTSGFSKSGHAKTALESARQIIRATRDGSRSAPWVPVGIGVHTGPAYVGAVDSDASKTDIVVLGDTANTGARLASSANAGEILVSQNTANDAGMATSGLELRHLELKGHSQLVDVWVLVP